MIVKLPMLRFTVQGVINMGRITFDISNPTDPRKTHKMIFQILSFIILVSFTGLMAGLYFVPQFLEQPSHTVLEREGNFEIGQYENILLPL